MATEQDPERTLTILRTWLREGPEQPIIAIDNPVLTSGTWIFYQENREGDLEVSAEAIRLLQQRGQLDLRRDGPEGTCRAYPR